MLVKRTMLALIAVCAIATISLVDSAEADPNSVKNFAKLNEFLEKNVKNDYLEANVDAANSKLKSGASLMFDGSLKEALNTFVQLPLALASDKDCRDSIQMLEQFDGRLNDKTHQSTKNYPVGRVERILANVAYKNYRMCRLGTEMDPPELKYAFKQHAYDQINEDLVDKERSKDPEANMRAAEEILYSLDNKEGSYARALKQLLSLRTILTEESCNEQGMEILMKNTLATRNRANKDYTDDLRRIIHIVQFYAIQHAKVCHPIYMKRVLPHVKELDLQTYKKVLAFMGAHSFKYSDDKNKLAHFVSEVESEHHIDFDFTTPMLKNVKFGIASYEYLDGRQLLNYLKAVTKGKPEKSKFLGWVLDERVGKRVQKKDKVAELYDEYIIKPCEKFNSVFESDMRAFRYNFRPISGAIDDLPAPLNFQFISSAYVTCRTDIQHRSDRISRMLHYL